MNRIQTQNTQKEHSNTHMARLSQLLTILTVAVGASASLVAQARRALEERQSSSSPPNAIQNWSNDFATLDFKTGSNGLFSVDWNNRPGGNFVVGRGWQPARDMYVSRDLRALRWLTDTGW